MAVVKSQAYDCTLLGDDVEVDVVPCTYNGPTWPIVGNQVAVGFMVWVIFVMLSAILARWWRRVCLRQPEGSPPTWARRYIGEISRRAEEPLLEQCLEWSQLAASTVLIVMFIFKTYQMSGRSQELMFKLEIACACICVFHSAFAYIRSGFSLAHALSVTAFLDCLTLPALFLQHAPKFLGGGSLITLSYLRTFHQLASIQRLREIGVLEHFMSDFSNEICVVMVELVNVVVTISGTMWILEAMGDIPGFEDQFWASGMGDISFFSMMYFTFVTISTVGYGDYSPTTVQSRIFIVLSIFAGVTFFSYISVHILNIIEMEASGRGRFRPAKRWGIVWHDRGHILVVGGGVTMGSATVLETFLKALCASRSAVGAEAPEVVLLSQSPRSEAVTRMLKQPWAGKLRIHFFVGSALNKDDMNRVRALESSMIFVIANTETDDTVAEDQRNIMIATSISRQFPNIQFRLMVVGLPALRLASQVGLSEFCCFSVEAFKAAIAGTSLRCPGFSTLWLNLALPNLPDTSHGYEAGLKRGQKVSAWLEEYVAGSDLEPYGFLPSDHYLGKTFREVAIEIACKVNLIVIAAQIGGAIVINPTSAVLDSRTVLYALAEDPSSCDAAARNGNGRVSSWLPQFELNRKTGEFGARQRAKVVKRQSIHTLENAHLASLNAFDNGVGVAENVVSPHLTVGAASGETNNSHTLKPVSRLMLPAMSIYSSHADGHSNGQKQPAPLNSALNSRNLEEQTENVNPVSENLAN